MEDYLHIIVYRHGNGPWQEKTSGVFAAQRLAENYCEILRAQNPGTEYAIVRGFPSMPETAAEVEARLGTF